MNTRSLPVVIRRMMPTAPLPANYHAARIALTECARIDECKDWADQSAAWASYAKQANDDDLFEQATRIRTRAEERIGELLLSLVSGRRDTATKFGIKNSQYQRAVNIARVPKNIRDELIEASPTIVAGRLAAMGMKCRPMYQLSEREMKRRDIENIINDVHASIVRSAKDCSEISAAQIAKCMRREVDTLRAPLRSLIEWLDEFEHHLPKGKRK